MKALDNLNQYNRELTNITSAGPVGKTSIATQMLIVKTDDALRDINLHHEAVDLHLLDKANNGMLTSVIPQELNELKSQMRCPPSFMNEVAMQRCIDHIETIESTLDHAVRILRGERPHHGKYVTGDITNLFTGQGKGSPNE